MSDRTIRTHVALLLLLLLAGCHRRTQPSPGNPWAPAHTAPPGEIAVVAAMDRDDAEGRVRLFLHKKEPTLAISETKVLGDAVAYPQLRSGHPVYTVEVLGVLTLDKVHAPYRAHWMVDSVTGEVFPIVPEPAPG